MIPLPLLPTIVALIRIKALPHFSPPLNAKALFSSIIQELFWNKRIGWSFFFWKQIWSLQSIKHKEEPISFALMLHSSLSVQRRSYNIRNATCWLSVGKREKKKKRGTLSIPFRTLVRDVHQLKDACLVFWFLFTICVMPISTTTSWKWIVSMYLPISAFLWSLPSSNETCVLILPR